MYKREHMWPQRRKTPSFSSSLLDAICQSIAQEEEEASMLKKDGKSISKWEKIDCLSEVEDVSRIGRAFMIEKWVQKQSSYGHTSMHVNTTSSSSSESSGYGCIYSSSDEQSIYKAKSRQNPVVSDKYVRFEQKQKQQKAKQESGGFTKTKLKAMKLYGELKKVKQPISPGSKISSFLNSIFNSSNAKKAKMCYVGAVKDVSIECKSKSACSSASSFSRSCLSKTPNSRGKLSSNGTKRSVRFCPVGVIVDEDSRPCGHKCIYGEEPSLLPSLNVQNFVKSSSVKQELNNYQKKTASQFDFRGFLEEEEYDDDADSYASSDLFELDSLIGVGRYREELPVYETTNLKTNQAIANGLIL